MKKVSDKQSGKNEGEIGRGGVSRIGRQKQRIRYVSEA